MREGWTYKKLGEVCESELGKTLNSAKDTGKLYPYLCAVNVLWDRIDTSSLKETRFEETELERYSVKKGDLLICEGGDIGRAAIWNKEQPIQYQNALHRVRFNDEVLPRFCLMYLRCLKEKGILDGRYGKGVTIKHLVKSSLLSIPIPVPPIAEQERIVAELDLLQGIIEKKKEQLKAYDQLAQSIFYTMFGDPVENERKWDISELNNVCDVRDGTHDTPKYHEEGYPLITSKNVVDGRIIFDNVNFISKEDFDNISKRSRVDDGDIIMPMIGTIGKPTIVVKDRDFAIKNVALIKFIPNTRVLNIFIQSIMASSSFDTYMKSRNKGGTQKFIALGDIRKLKVPVPPLSLQQEFAEKVEAIERQKALVQQSIEETQTMFDYTMDKYFG